MTIFCHFGHTKYAVSKIKKLGTNNLSGLSAIGGVVYARDLSIRAPHNVFTNGKKIKRCKKAWIFIDKELRGNGKTF